MNAVYNELWTVSRPHSENHYKVLFCKSSVDTTAKNLYMNTRGSLYERKSPIPVPNPYTAYQGGYFQRIGQQWYTGDDQACPAPEPVSGA